MATRDEQKADAGRQAKAADKLSAFWADYGNMTVGKVLTAAAKGDDALRQQILAHERAKLGRVEIIQALVNWNS